MFKYILISFFVLIHAAQAIETEAQQAYMIDFNTGLVLFEKNADEKMVPSSMSKIMTAYMVFERMKSGDVNITDKLYVSQKAWKMGGSRMFVKVDSQVSIDDLLCGAIVQSGNDACVVIAEGLSGTEQAFAEEMTRKAHDMGATHTTFVNATGWPEEGHLTTAKDLALIAEKTIRDFPKEYEKYYSMTEFTYNDIKQGNRNPLLYKGMGADGMKTGSTDAGGYGLVASAKQGDRRIILVVNGLKNARERDHAATALINWGFSAFKEYGLFKKGDVVEMADVWGGAENKVPLVSGEDIFITLPRSQKNDLEAKIVYDSPISSPIKEGDEVGFIEVSIPEKESIKYPLYSSKTIEKAGFFKRINNAISYLLWGKHS